MTDESDTALRGCARAGSVLCVMRGARLTSAGCLSAPQGFAEACVAPVRCRHTEEIQCVAFELADAGSQVWLYSGDFYDAPGAHACEGDTRELALSAPACEPASQCDACSPDAGALCALAPTCD